mmetsp:Transcript_36840/g.84896  ORF Transcript_36840/g.84896 Transcript_36840/m.84896 type:complete len:227 (+) Transcript_36840:73-753(+)
MTESPVPASPTKAARTAPKVLFVLGLPGAGKGTQCAKVIEAFSEWAHVSAGDCLRAERNNPDSKDGELINSLIKNGKLVPSAITCKLLQKAMAALREEGKKCFLIDGYPRNIENDDTWLQEIGEDANVLGVLLYEGEEKALLERLVGTNRGREDEDKSEVIQRRFKSYHEETMPVIERYKSQGKTFSIDGLPAPEEVWQQTEKLIASFMKEKTTEDKKDKDTEDGN